MSNAKLSILVFLAALAAIVSMSVFTVDERELAIKFRFGEIVKSDYQPGLHFKFPIVNNVRKFEDRILPIQNPTERFLTAEKKNLSVDFFVRWRIIDVADYYRATGGDEIIASQRLIEIIKDRIRGEFALRTVQEVVSAERSDMMDDMLIATRLIAKELGITVIDVRVKRIEFPDEVVNSVFDRMRQERARQAAELRAEGAEDAETIRAEADRERTIILAEAYRDAEIVRGEGDAKAAEIYAKAFNQDREFYSFYRSIEAYKTAIGSDSDILVVKPDSEFFKYLNKAKQP